MRHLTLVLVYYAQQGSLWRRHMPSLSLLAARPLFDGVSLERELVLLVNIRVKCAHLWLEVYPHPFV